MIIITVLTDIFGKSPRVSILETFVENYNDLIYIADIVRMTGYSKMTVAYHIKKLLKEGIITYNGKVGIVKFYKLNIDNQKAKLILLLENHIVSEKLGEVMEGD